MSSKNVCSCGCAECPRESDGACDCGYGWWGKKHWVIRVILWIAILTFVFSMGVAAGKLKASVYGYKTLLRYGGSYAPMMMWDENGNSYMMRRFDLPKTDWDALPPATDGVE